MGQSEMARALLGQLHDAGVVARLSGGVLQWQLDAGEGARTLRVHCFWYERAHMGELNTRQSPSKRDSVRADRSRDYTGPEYLVLLHTQGAKVAEGRTVLSQEVVECARRWLADMELDALVQEVPYVDADRRAMQAVARRLAPQLRWELNPDSGNTLWISGGERRCEVRRSPAPDAAVTCSFLIGPQQVAYHPAPEDVPAAVASWLGESVSLEELRARVRGVELEPHAEVLENDPAHWHWLQVLDRIADRDEVLMPLRELIVMLSRSAIATQFYSYSSHMQLRFSASSHHVWVNEGLPVITPDEQGAVLVNDMRFSLVDAVHHVEGILAAHPVRPFFGSAAHHELPLLAECLTLERSELRPELLGYGGQTQLVVVDPSGQRRCTIEGTSVAFDIAHRTSASWPTRQLAARAIRRYCEANESLDDILADPAAFVMSRNGIRVRLADRRPPR